MIEKIKRFYRFEELGTGFRIEAMGGVTTFMTMAYIIFVNPGILKAAGMDFEAVMAATCLASALATAVMALAARYPIALAPGMGLNAFFAFEIVAGHGVPWQTALGMVFVSGVIFLALSFLRVREMLVSIVPDALKMSISAGIGLFIAFIGLQHAGLVVDDPATLVALGDLRAPRAVIALVALAATVAMMAAGVKGAILHGIVVAGGLGVILGELEFQGEGLGAVVSLTPDISATAFKLDVMGIFKSWEWIALTLALLFFDMFDTVGTLIGVSEQAGLMEDGKLPRANRAFMADAAGTVAGSFLGTSTVTSYIESAAGVAAGARTGFASLVTAALFLAAIFFSPLVSLLSEEFVTASALIVVGCFMMSSVRGIAWSDLSEALPAFLTMALMPLTFSISRGLAAGFIAWPLAQAASGKAKDVHPLLYLLAAVLLTAVVLSYIVI